jgi:hypothetical protein
MEVLVFGNRYVLSYPKVDDPRGACLASFEEIANEAFKSDVHFVAYGADLVRRHSVALFKDPAHADKIPIVNLEMRLAIFDADGPNHVRTDEWLESEVPKLLALRERHPGGYLYLTRGGYRIVFALPEPYPLRSQGDDDAWTALYLGWCAYAKRFGIEFDTACADWTRLYRAPQVVRDGVKQPLLSVDDPHSLGVWAPDCKPVKRAKTKGGLKKCGAPATEGARDPVPMGVVGSPYYRARIESAVHYLRQADLSIEGCRGRDRFFSVCLYLVRRQGLPLDVAAQLIALVYNPRLVEAGTTTWTPDEIMNRLESARDTASNVPWGGTIGEEEWNFWNRIGEKSA